MEHRTVATSDDGDHTQETHDSPSIPHHVNLSHQPSYHKTRPHLVPQTHPLPYKGDAGNTFLSDLSNYLQCPSAVDGSFGTGYSEHGTYAPFQKTGALPITSSASPEALLDVVSSVQGKLKYLEAILQLMIHERRQQGMHQSLAAEFASTMSQLFAAMSSGNGQHPSWSSFQVPSHGNDTLDIDFNGFNGDDVNNDLSGPLSGLMGGIQTSLNPSAGNVREALMGGTPMGSSVRVGNTDAGMLDQRSKQVGPMASFSGPLKLGNTHVNGFKTDMAKTVACSAVESVNSHGPSGSTQPHILKTDVTKTTQSTCAAEPHTSHGLSDMDYHVIISPDDQKEEDDDVEGESLPPGSYELVEMAATEILAEHTHFCEICGKGFKRDANLRMHMRGHGDEYKTPAALARPDKATRDSFVVKPRRYSCPYAGCKRNKKHSKFQPLKTMLCVKNHYKRSHCPKLLVCSRCKTKKFSVVADLKTHEKHCGQDKWQCSCGTTFSRKDKLLGHIGLFAGHTPAVPAHEAESPAAAGVEASFDGFSVVPMEGVEGSTQDKPVVLTNESSVNDVSVVGSTGVHLNGHFNEQSSAETNDRNLSFASVSNGALLRDYPYPSADGVTSDVSELQGLLSDSFFHQGESSN